jgi:hypothetical protein
MKKKLEADLISIAHRILKLKNKEDLTQLHLETQKLYEKLSVLKFVEENFSDVKPTIGNSNIQELVNDALENEPEVEEVEVAVAPEEIEIQPELVEEIEEEAEEEIEEDDFSDDEEEDTEDEYSDEEEETEDETEELEDEEEDSEEEEEIEEEESEENEEESEEEEGEFEPHFELFNVEEVEDKKPKTEAKQISFEDLLGSSSEPVFERVFDPIQEEEEEESAEEEETVFSPVFEMEASEEIEEEEKAIPNFEFDKEISINEAFAKTITFGLNDRIAFEKQLFAGSSEDLNRVVSQLSTFDTFEEAQNFIEDMVKPDYDNWEGKEEYVTRFMEIVEKKFA